MFFADEYVETSQFSRAVPHWNEEAHEDSQLVEDAAEHVRYATPENCVQASCFSCDCHIFAQSLPHFHACLFVIVFQRTHQIQVL